MMSTERAETIETGAAEFPRRIAGSGSERPCWRDATEPMYGGEAEPKVCAEHARCLRLGQDVDDWALALAEIEEWIAGPVAKSDSGAIERLALNMRDEARSQYARASAKSEAAGGRGAAPHTRAGYGARTAHDPGRCVFERPRHPRARARRALRGT
jgi:hypothetical protein